MMDRPPAQDDSGRIIRFLLIQAAVFIILPLGLTALAVILYL
ncbi:phosphoribosylformylglycinamidine synthase-associated small membrane protein [Coralliovum pocilloporae]